MHQCDSTRLAGNLIGAHAVQEALRRRAADVELGEPREVEDRDALVYRRHLAGHDVEYIVAAIAIVFGAAIEREPLGTLPAEGLGMNTALRAKPAMQRTHLAR